MGGLCDNGGALPLPIQKFRSLVASFLVGSCAATAAVELKRGTAAAFDHYVATLEAGINARVRSGRLLRLEPRGHRSELLAGAVVIEPAQANGETEIDAGLIHDWIGGLFVPGATLASTLRVVQDYAHNKDYYAPEIAASRILSHSGNDFDVYLRIVKSKFFMTDVLNTDHVIHFVPIDPTRMYCRSYSSRIAEVADAGKPSERELPVGIDRGLLWRMYGYWFFEQKDGGVYIEYESVTLSRNIPFGMGKVLGPILHNVPAESLRSSLEKTRKAILASPSRTT